MKTYIRIRDGATVSEAEAYDKWGVLKDGYRAPISLFMRDAATPEHVPVADTAVSAYRTAAARKHVTDAMEAERLRAVGVAQTGLLPRTSQQGSVGLSPSQRAYQKRVSNSWKEAGPGCGRGDARDTWRSGTEAGTGREQRPPQNPARTSPSQQAYVDRVKNAWKTAQ